LTGQISESLVTKIWQHYLLDRTDLVTEDGEPIRIIYPGRLNDDRGADLVDAVLATNHGLSKGDVEVHVHSSCWRVHRHHQDPYYNQVILHVVMWQDDKIATSLQNGETVATLALNKYIPSPTSYRTELTHLLAAPNMPCHRAEKHLPSGTIAKFLDSAGEERFLAKATRFEADLAQTGAAQVLYQGIMGALGYLKNKLPFLELARKLPLQVLESLNQDKISDEDCLARQQALLLGTAGLLPSQRDHYHRQNKINERWVVKLETLWESFHQTGAMSANDWHLFKVRPNNFPIRRIAAMSYLILRHREKGIFEEVMNKIREATSSQKPHCLEQMLQVTAEGYWVDHFDFGGSSRLRLPTLLGSPRAANIIINVLLPFTFAWSRLTSPPEISGKALDLYRHYPGLIANTVERHMSQQFGLSHNLVNSARRQQGLIHIYNTLCSQGKCHDCPLGEAR